MKLGVFSNLGDFLTQTTLSPKGCFVDTSILFAASYPNDKYNTETEPVFEKFRKFGLSSFTNVNVKYEFLENHRRVLLADALVMFYGTYKGHLPPLVAEKLKSFETTHRDKLKKEETSKIETEQQIKFIRLLRPLIIGDKNAWKILCEDFLQPQLEPLWEDSSRRLGIVEIKLRESDNSPLLHTRPEWQEVQYLKIKRINLFLSRKKYSTP